MTNEKSQNVALPFETVATLRREVLNLQLKIPEDPKNEAE